MVARTVLPAVATCGALLLASGCAEEGTADDATVTAYVSAYLCESAKEELAEQGGRAGERRVRVRCLPEGKRPGESILAAVGRNARRVSEDSSAIAYAEPAGPANRFGPQIIEAAGIPVILVSSGQLAIERILRAIREAGDSDALRESVAVELGVG